MRCSFIRRISVKQKIFLATTLMLVSSILITGVFVQRQSSSLYKESIDQTVQLMMQKYAGDIEACFQSAEALQNTLKLECLSFVPRMEAQEDVTQNYRIYLELQEKLNLLCKAMFGDSAYECYLFLNSELPIASLFQTPDISQVYGNMDRAATSFAIYSDEALIEEEWFQNIEEDSKDPYWFVSPDNKQCMLSVCNLSDFFLIDSNVVHYSMGTLVVNIDISRFSEKYEDNSFGKEMEVVITDFDYRILYAEDDSLLNKNYMDMIEEKDILLERVDSYQIVTMDGQKYCLWKQALMDEMQLFTVLPEQSFNRQVRISIQTILLLFLMVLFAEVILAAFFSGIISRPIQRLSAHINQSLVPVPIAYEGKNKDEISTLYRAYNEMAEKQEQLIQEIYESTMKQKQTEYKLLQSQINPHFLYNTLDSVSCAAIVNGEEELSHILSLLAKVLRYNVNKPEQLVDIHDEIEIINNYLTIQQFRYENRISFTCEIPETMTSIKIPKMILQPLVENGIFYGRVNEDGYRHISMYADFVADKEELARGKNERIRIRICNEHLKLGNSLEADIRLLNDYLHGKCELTRKSSGLGIRNVQQRIKLTYGEPYGIYFEQMGDQVAAVVEIAVYM